MRQLALNEIENVAGGNDYLVGLATIGVISVVISAIASRPVRTPIYQEVCHDWVQSDRFMITAFYWGTLTRPKKPAPIKLLDMLK